MTRRGGKRVFARGGRTKRPHGEMNKGERAYADHLEALKAAGKIADWRYESLTLKLAPDCRFTADFAVMMPDGEIVLHEIKGRTRSGKPWIEEDARIKIKTGAVWWWWWRLVVVWPRADRSGWETWDVEAGV